MQWYFLELDSKITQSGLHPKYLCTTTTGAGLVFVSPLRVCMRYMVRLHFPSSNNVVEYEALINGLRIAIELGIRRLDIRGDSQLVVN